MGPGASVRQRPSRVIEGQMQVQRAAAEILLRVLGLYRRQPPVYIKLDIGSRPELAPATEVVESRVALAGGFATRVSPKELPRVSVP